MDPDSTLSIPVLLSVSAPGQRRQFHLLLLDGDVVRLHVPQVGAEVDVRLGLRPVHERAQAHPYSLVSIENCQKVAVGTAVDAAAAD
jgi:hypothetical protein